MSVREQAGPFSREGLCEGPAHLGRHLKCDVQQLPQVRFELGIAGVKLGMIHAMDTLIHRDSPAILGLE